MNPISNTAFYCCGVRMQDAAQSNPVCDDIHAKAFMNDEGLRILEAFKDEAGPNASTVARHRIIDDLLRQELRADPRLCVVIIGAGFDSRACRLEGGVWVELDEPQVIIYKNERLPLSNCSNELHRIPIDFARESLEEKLSPFSGHTPVVVVIEGVLMYLEEETIIATLRTVRRLFPGHTLICDLMNRRFIEKSARTLHEKITGLAAPFRFIADNPEKIFLDNGYMRTAKISIIEKAVEFGSIRMPAFLLKTFLRSLASGYTINVFRAGESRT